MAKVINVEGIIGAGKTTLVETLNRDYEVEVVPEPVDDNPLLDKFYEDPESYAFTIQMWLLSKRHAANRAAFWLARAGRDILVDRGRRGDRCFAQVNHKLARISDDEMMVYDEFFTAMNAREPDVIVMLDITAEEAMARIEARGRACESGIDIGYLRKLRIAHMAMVEEARKRGTRVMVYENQWFAATVARDLGLAPRSA